MPDSNKYCFRQTNIVQPKISPSPVRHLHQRHGISKQIMNPMKPCFGALGSSMASRCCRRSSFSRCFSALRPLTGPPPVKHGVPWCVAAGRRGVFLILLPFNLGGDQKMRGIYLRESSQNKNNNFGNTIEKGHQICSVHFSFSVSLNLCLTCKKHFDTI